jgi:hypothetical protein
MLTNRHVASPRRSPRANPKSRAPVVVYRCPKYTIFRAKRKAPTLPQVQCTFPVHLIFSCRRSTQPAQDNAHHTTTHIFYRQSPKMGSIAAKVGADPDPGAAGCRAGDRLWPPGTQWLRRAAELRVPSRGIRGPSPRGGRQAPCPESQGLLGPRAAAKSACDGCSGGEVACLSPDGDCRAPLAATAKREAVGQERHPRDGGGEPAFHQTETAALRAQRGSDSQEGRLRACTSPDGDYRAALAVTVHGERDAQGEIRDGSGQIQQILALT